MDSLTIRLIGLALGALSVAAFQLLARLAVVPAAERSVALELAVGAACVTFATTGAALLGVGAALFAPMSAPLRSRHSATGVVTEF